MKYWIESCFLRCCHISQSLIFSRNDLWTALLGIFECFIFYKAIFSSSTYTPSQHLVTLSTTKRSVLIQKIIFYFICLYFITMLSFGSIPIFFASPWGRHFVFLLGISTLCKNKTVYSLFEIIIFFHIFSVRNGIIREKNI